jgi:NACHT domain
VTRLRSRRHGITLLALCVVVLAVAIGLSLLGHTSPAVQVIPFALGIPVLYLGWLTYRDAKTASDRTALPQVADDLAVLVRKQWETEAEFRQVNDSDIIPVRWEQAAPDLVEKLPDALRSLLSDSGSVPPISDLKRRLSQIASHGRERSLASMFKRIPSGRLVVLGQGGSGKTVQLIRLLIDLHKERKPGTAVPVLVPLASWDPTQDNLEAWLISRLTLDYQALKAPWETSTRICNRAEALLDEHLLVIILDGLDEVPAHVRTTAIAKINKFLKPGAKLVLSCRTEEYRNALTSSGSPGRPVKLSGALGITLRPLSHDAIRHYLLGDDGLDSVAGLRWSPVLRELTSPGSPLAEALQTPLIAALARDVYEPQLAGLPPQETPRSPEELTDHSRFRDPAAIKEHLFEALIQTVYQPTGDADKDRWQSKKARHWLSFLAHQLRKRDEEYNILAWWELREAAPQWLVLGTIGTICGLASGVAAGLGAHVGRGIGVGLGAGAILGLAAAIPIRRASGSGSRPSVGIAGALIGSIGGALLGAFAGRFGIGHAVWPFGGLAVALAIAIGVGSSTNLAGGLVGGLAGGALATILEGIGTGVPAGIVNGIGMGLCAAFAARYVGRESPSFRVRWSSLGLVCGIAIGTAVGLITTRAAGSRWGLICGLAVGLLSAIPCGMWSLFQTDDRPVTTSPEQSLRQDSRNFWMTAPAAGFAAVIAGLIGGGLASVSAAKIHPTLGNVTSDGLAIGIAAGIIIGLGFGLYHAASVFFFIARFWLACQRRVPWRLMRFLVDAHQVRGILRQSGSFYQFRHLELMHWLADQWQPDPSGPLSRFRPAFNAGNRDVEPATPNDSYARTSQ